jgi:hypothetical protein
MTPKKNFVRETSQKLTTNSDEKNCPGFCLKELGKIMKNLSQVSKNPN